MKKNPSLEKFYKKSQNHQSKLSKSEPQEQFETQSSVYQYYHKVRTKDDIYKTKITALQMKANTMLSTAMNKVEQQRIKLQRMLVKFKQLRHTQNDYKIFWKNALLETSSTIQYFMCKLRQYYETQDYKIKVINQYYLTNLRDQLKQQILNRQKMLEQIKQYRQNHDKYKCKFKDWIKLYLKSSKNISSIEEDIIKRCINLKNCLEEKRGERESKERKVMEEFYENKKILYQLICKQQYQRQNNKEQILEIFEKICLQNKISLP